MLNFRPSPPVERYSTDAQGRTVCDVPAMHVPMASIRFGTKGHPETAGEGVEYIWGGSKKYFRRHTDYSAKTLVARVRTSLSDDVISLDLMRKYARRARDYDYAYARLHNGGSALQHVDIEKMVKMVKNHRGAADFDHGWIEST